jgi:lysophospholipase L1-like esterase
MRKVVVGAGVVIATLLGTLPVAAAPQDPPRIVRVVTLGDSYSSGSGIHRHASDYDDHGPERHSFDASTRLGASACHRELDTTPGVRLAAELGASALMVACAGAVVADVPNQLDAATILGRGVGTLLTLTIGGNDIRSGRGENWGEVVLRCITTFGCDSARNAIAGLQALEDDLAALYGVMVERLPLAKMRVLAYPRLMQRDRWGCVGVPGVSRDEAAWVDGQVDDLNAAIERAVVRARGNSGVDLQFVPVIDEFAGHGACRTWQRDRYVNDVLLGQTLSRRLTAAGQVTEHFQNDLVTFSTASFHPSQKGYDAYGRALAASL